MLLIELFPFGRKKFEFELLPLLEESRSQAAKRPLVACSLRDILVSRRHDQERYEERVITIANRYFDAILVHSDPTFASLDESLHTSARLIPAIHYTGFVMAERPQYKQTPAPGGPILVSAGGGLYGAPLFKAVFAAYELLDKTHRAALKLVAGPFFPELEWEALCAAVTGYQGIQPTRSVPDLFEELCRASASISQCGYNTALRDSNRRAGAGRAIREPRRRRAVSKTRSSGLEKPGVVRVLDQNEMTPERLADEMDALLTFRPRRPQLELNGAQRSAEILYELMRARRISKRQPQRANKNSRWQV